MINHPNRSRRGKTAFPKIEHNHEVDYAALLLAVQSAFDVARTGPLFCTDASGLYDAYLDGVGAERAVHSCTACRHFIERFGGLVAIADDGTTVPAMWNPAAVPAFYAPIATVLHSKVRRARITQPFLTAHGTLGTPQTGAWTHFAVRGAKVFRHALLTPGQAAAAKREDFRTVATALADFTAPMLDEALRLLRGDHLHRSDRFVAPVKWLRDLHDRPKGRPGENVLWSAIATAPDGYCHPRASVIGSLLEDIAAGMTFADIKARFDAKVHPLAYQRPQAAPSAGNIAAAEAMFEKLGLAPSLERRFARLDECVTVWKPAPPKAAATGGGVFGHIKAKAADDGIGVVTPAITMTWHKFLATALPMAEAIELHAPAHGHYIALLTAVHADAPPLLKWDNPVSWYVYNGGSPALQWRVGPNSWVRVNGIVPSPATWGADPKAYLGEGFVAVLDGAVDTRTGSGNALFPECLRGELHAVRATIEAYSRCAEISGREEASACGYSINKGNIGITLRVKSGPRWDYYKIDRWD